jgi:phosphate transport system protein
MTTRGLLSREERQIRDNLHTLSDMTLEAIGQSIEALQHNDPDLAKIIIENDQEINHIQALIEEECVATIATQQPVATDLRGLVAAMHIAVELERIGDYAAGIANTVLKMQANKITANFIDEITNMAGQCRNIMRSALAAYMDSDAVAAAKVAADDKNIDQTQNELSNKIIRYIGDHPDSITYGTHLLWAVHSLERIGDRATNICEQTLYIIRGEQVDLNR